MEPTPAITPLRVTATICGACLVVIGVIALTTGEFAAAAVWVVPAALAAGGLAGLAALVGGGRRAR